MERRLASAAAIYAAGSLAAKAAKFLLIPVYVACLTGADIGTVYFLEAVITISGRFFSLGLGMAARRIPADIADAEERAVYVKSLWLAGLVAAALLYGATALAVLEFSGTWALQVPIEAVLYALAIGALRSGMHVPQGYQVLALQAGRHQIVNIVDIVITSAAIAVAIGPYRAGLEGYLHAQALGAVVLTAVCYGLVGRTRRLSFKRLGASLRYAVPGLPHFMFAWGLTFADRFVIERFVSLKDLGIYVIGYQIASVVALMNFAIVNAYVARLFRIGDVAARQARVAADLPVALAIMSAIAAAMALLVPEALSLVTSPEYAVATGVARIVCLGLVFQGLFQLGLLVLYYDRQLLRVSVISGIALAVNVALNIVLLPRLGIEGGAWATVASFAFAAALTLHVIGRGYLRAPPVRWMPAAVAIGVATAAIALPAAPGWDTSLLARMFAAVLLALLAARTLGTLRMGSEKAP